MLRSRFSVLGLVALVLALGGTATAASITLITGREVKDGSLTGADFANASVGAAKLKSRSLSAMHIRAASLTTLEVKDGTLQTADLSGAALAALTGAVGPAGATGPQGATGERGPTGASGPAGPPGTGIALAGYVQASAQTLPGDSQFHPAWTMTVTATANQIFIITGSVGNANAPCSLDQQVAINGIPNPSVFNGGFLRLPAGSNAISYEVRAGCPIDVPDQEVIAIPFTLP